MTVASMASLVLLGACGGNATADRQLADDNTGTIEGGIIVDTSIPVTTVPVAGSATELLPELGVEMSRLSAQIAGDGDEAATLARIEAIWTAIEPEVDATRPELVGGLLTTVELAASAVNRKRPADADKAFSLLTDLIDNFTGDA